LKLSLSTKYIDEILPEEYEKCLVVLPIIKSIIKSMDYTALSAAEYILSISLMITILVMNLQCYSFGVLVQNREKSI
jgi:hypothetical protein